MILPEILTVTARTKFRCALAALWVARMPKIAVRRPRAEYKDALPGACVCTA